MQDHPPIAQLVTKPLDQQCAVGGYHCGSGALVVQQSPQVVGGIVVETQTRTTCAECRTVQGGQLAGEGAECGAELGGRPASSPRQNGNRAGWPGAGITSTRSWVISVIRQLVAPSEITSPGRDS